MLSNIMLSRMIQNFILTIQELQSEIIRFVSNLALVIANSHHTVLTRKNQVWQRQHLPLYCYII